MSLPLDTISNLSQSIVDVYTTIEDELIFNIAKHFNTGKNLVTTEWQIKKLAELGKLTQENINIIANMVGQVPELTKVALESVMWETLKDLEPSFAEAVKQGYLSSAKYPPGASKEMLQALDSLSKQAINDFNLVNSNMLNSSLDAYRKIVSNTVTMANYAEAQQILNTAAGSVVTGVASRQKALADAIKKMSNSGITGFYDKAGKEWSPEAYINMSIRTTMSNTANKTVFNRCDEYGNDLVEISSHSGARPKCAADQGKLYSRAGKSGTAEDLSGNKIQYSSFSSTSHGQPDGILGINCGHRPSAFTPGFSRMSPPVNDTKEENDIAYKQSIEQRKIERQTREAKREAQAQKLAGNQEAFNKAAARVKLKQDQYKAFCNDTGRTPRPDRLQVTGYDKKTAQDVKNANNKAIQQQKAKSAGVKADLTNTQKNDIMKMNKISSAIGEEKSKQLETLLNNAPADIKNVWNKYADDIAFGDVNYKGGAHYSPAKRNISLDINRDAIGGLYKEPYDTITHEIGHLFDGSANMANSGSKFGHFSFSYKNGAFSTSLKNEADAYTKFIHDKLKAEAVAKGHKASTVSVNTARQKIREELYEKAKSNGYKATGDVSDIFEGATKAKITGTSGHGKSYWNTHDVSTEAFAEMFGASITSPQSLEQIKHYFPNSYNIFLEIIKNM